MIPNAAALHRSKHFDLLLERELELIKRKYEQNLITHTKLERSIRRDGDQSPENNTRKVSLPFNEIYNEQTETFDYHKMRALPDKNSNKKRLSPISVPNQNQTNETAVVAPPQISPRHRRYCLKGQRLPPIVKANVSHRTNRISKDPQWVTSLQQSNIQKENGSDSFGLIDDELSTVKLSELTPIQKQIHSFLDTLPTYKDIQYGFDGFAPASLYSYHLPVTML